MDIQRGTSFRVLYGGRSLLTPSFFLMRWTKVDTDVSTYCIATNDGSTAGPVVLTVVEMGTTTPDPFTGQVQLGDGDQFLEVWEQTSAVNLFPPDTDPEWSELVRVWSDTDMPDPDPVDPCDGCPGGGCLVDIVFNYDGAEVARVDDVDPCEANTINLTLN